MRTFISLVLILLCLQVTSNVNGQVVNKVVTVNYTSKTIEEVLQDLSTKYGVKFSYSSNYVPLKKKVTVNVKQQPIAVVLKKVLAGTGTTFTEVGNQIVIKKDPNSQQQLKTSSSGSKKVDIKEEEETVETTETLTSVIEPKDTTEERQNITVSTATEPVFFEEPHIELPATAQDTIDRVQLKKMYKQEKKRLKKQYYAKLDSIDASSDKSSKGKLQEDFKRVVRKLEAELNTIGDSLNLLENNRTDSLNNKEKSNSAGDSNVYFHKVAQATFITPIGTNGLNSSQTVNNLSFNFAGQAAGVEGFELGLLLNSDKAYVHGTQIAGLGNIVGKDVRGVQIAPLFNINGKYTQGVQISGFLNMAGDSLYAFQAAGFMNIVGGGVKGSQIAGFSNLARGSVDGFQAAGFNNVVTGQLQGAQVAGLMNTVTSNADGGQVAGFMNVAADTIRGVQIAGFMNYGKIVHGSQIGVFNFADSVSGAQIGFLSFSRRGYRKVELFAGDVLHANLAFKTGSHKFYNILAVAARLDLDNMTWASGYGIGTYLELNKTLHMNIDAICYYVHSDSQKWEEVNLLNQVKATMGVNLTKHTSLFFGPSFNVAVSDHYNTETGKYGMPVVPSWKFYNKTYSDGWNVAMWIGGNIGIRF